MPITGNVAWDGRLEAYKGRDTTHYVTAAAAVARVCAVCGEPVRRGEPLSLIVEISESTAPDGSEKLIFVDCVCHRRCGGPAVAVCQSEWGPEEVVPIAARVLLTLEDGGATRTVPVLAFTLYPTLTFRENGGEQTSALVSVLLTHGFRLALSARFIDIVERADDVHDSCSITLDRQGRICLTLDGQPFCRETLDPEDRDDAVWLEAARRDAVLVISGDNLLISNTELDITEAARMGTLVTGLVSTRS
jgi:hypothetical protein